MAHPKEDDNNFFFNTFMPLALQALRFNYFITTNKALSFSTLFKVIEEFYDEIKNSNDDDERLKLLLSNCLKNIGTSPKAVKQAHVNKLQKALSTISFDERVIIGAVDCLGLEGNDVNAIMDNKLQNKGSFEKNLDKIQNKLLKKLKNKDYADARKELNDYFSRTQMQTEHAQKIQNLILPAYDVQIDTSKTMHAAEKQLLGQRLIKFGVLGLAVIGVALALLMRATEGDATAKIITALSYETTAVESDPDRLDFPTGKFSEVRSYFADNRNLNIQPALLRATSGWSPTSAGIIDYDFAQIAVSRYRRQENTLYLYSFRGDINALAAERIEYDDFSYMPYSSPDLNMIVWESEADAKIISVLASRISGDELVNLANKHID
ncbi:MAG: hypothetical protein OYH77_04675 [Pseudomonadota bacterium]|nr:hypothetical protein [Pseudomonadota bacterium]